MRGINKVILIGNPGADPEIRYTPGGEAVASLRLATSESWTDRTSGERQESTEWHRVVLWRRLAEVAGQYLKKGSRAYIEGKLRTRRWQDRDGQDRYTTEIIAHALLMLDGRAEGDADEPAAGAGPRAGTPPPAPAYQAPIDFDDDIPF